MATTLIDSQQQDFQDIVNNNNYRFRVGLLSVDGRYQELKIGAINSLVIEDDYTNFFHKGYIIINNKFDAVERIADFQNKEQAKTTTFFTPNKGFIFKGDSRDILVIDILPKLTEEANYSKSLDEDKAFRLLFKFAIYNSEEVLGEGPGEKFKKLYFWDLYYELLREKNSYFTTANYVESDRVENLNNIDRGINTGDAIKLFLKEFFSESDGYLITFNENFDKGGSKIYFSSPASFKGIDCLEYLLGKHVSDKAYDFDQCFLRIERGTYNFTFESLNKTFSKALYLNSSNSESQIGANYLETFNLGVYSDNNNEFEIESISFTPSNALNLGKFGTINNFVFDSMPGEISQQELVTHIVHSYDSDEKIFNIDQSRNTINSILSSYFKNYVTPFNKVSYDSAYSNFYPGEYRLLQKNVKNTFSIVAKEADQRLSTGRNKALFSSVFMNNSVLFRIPGSTHRQAGKFIGIDRSGAQPYSDFDSKFLGVYFVVEVKHVFEGNEYFNDLRCVKTYSYDNLFLNTNSK